MKVCGIICEYNPFHNGHFLHIKKTRELLGEDTAIVCCMSGNFVQRGEPAILPKHVRAKCALMSGADLVLEIPSAYSLLSAEGFAYAGVYLLSSLGIVTDISFGAENSDTALLSEIAGILCEHETVAKTLQELKSGVSYAAARERALYAAIKEKSAVISSPNNILGIEYIKAIKKLSANITPHAIKRVGTDHDSPDRSEEICSASVIRSEILSKGAQSIENYVPAESLWDDSENNMIFSNEAYDRFYQNMYTYLLRLKPSDFAILPDVSEGLEHRIVNAIKSSASVSEAVEKIKTRRYPLSRIRRILLRAYLNLPRELSEHPVPYCRVLGANEKGRMLLSDLRKKTEIPIITKPGHITKLSDQAQDLWNAESLCTDLYNSAMLKDILPGEEWRAGSVVL